SVAKQGLEQRLLVRGVDDQHLADPRQHQHAERVVDHRLVVDRQQLLADGPGDRIQARARAASEDDALARRHASAPMRPRRELPSSTRSTQAWLSKYQSTVSARPRSKV